MIIYLNRYFYITCYYVILCILGICVVYYYSAFRSNVNKYKNGISLLISGLLFSYVFILHQNRQDIGFVPGYSQNMYLEGAKLRYLEEDMGYYEIQPNNIRLRIHRVELNNHQIELLENDNSACVLLKNCAYEVNMFNLIKLRSTYNILYLDEDTYYEYLLDSEGIVNDRETGKVTNEERKKHTLTIPLDRWMEDVDLLDDDGELN